MSSLRLCNLHTCTYVCNITQITSWMQTPIFGGNSHCTTYLTIPDAGFIRSRATALRCKD